MFSSMAIYFISLHFNRLGSQEKRRSYTIPRKEALLWWIQVLEMQEKVDVGQFLGKYVTRMHQVPNQGLSAQTGSFQNFSSPTENKNAKILIDSNAFISPSSDHSKSPMVWTFLINQNCICKHCAKCASILDIIVARICKCLPVGSILISVFIQ